MVYARAHDHTVAEDYYAAMTVVEGRPDLASGNGSPAEPALSVEARLDLVTQMRLALDHALPAEHGPLALALSK